MDEYVLTQADSGFAAGGPAWRFMMVKPDGTFHAHIMPAHTLDARAIEYGIDVAERERLLEIAIHEAWMVHPLDESRLAQYGPDPAVAHGLTVPDGRGGQIGVTCHTADTIPDGHDAHVSRLEHCQRGIVKARIKLRLVDSILKHREDDWACAHIENEFRGARRGARKLVAEARRAAENR